jgi:outer membrane autotransporter protein
MRIFVCRIFDKSIRVWCPILILIILVGDVHAQACGQTITNATANSSGFSVNPGDCLINTGTITVPAGTGVTGVAGGPAGVTNTGVISGGRGVQLNGGGILTNEAGASISTRDSAVAISDGQMGSIYNAGTIYSSAVSAIQANHGFNNVLTVTGQAGTNAVNGVGFGLVNTQTGIIEGNFVGLAISGGSTDNGGAASNVYNAGRISSVQGNNRSMLMAAGGHFVNDRTGLVTGRLAVSNGATASDAYNPALRDARYPTMAEMHQSRVDNYGQIGEVTGAYGGIITNFQAVHLSYGGSVYNYAPQNGQVPTIISNGSYAVDALYMPMYVSNQGRIESLLTRGINLQSGGTVVNHATGTISNADGFTRGVAIGITTAAFAGGAQAKNSIVYNSGVIQSGSSYAACKSVAGNLCRSIEFGTLAQGADTSNSAVINNGNLIGDVLFGGQSNTFYMTTKALVTPDGTLAANPSATMYGVLQMGGLGHETVTFENVTEANIGANGSMITQFNGGGGGSDVLNFINSSYTGGQEIVNFETVRLHNGSSLVLNGLANPSAVTVGGNLNPALTTTLKLGGQSTDLSAVLEIDAHSSLIAGNGTYPLIAASQGQAVNIYNAGLIDLSRATRTGGGGLAGDALLVSGNYIGRGGAIALDTVLDADAAQTDRLVIANGSATGTSSLRIRNAGGQGALTVANGIRVIETANGATTAAGAFSLAVPVTAGPYEYLLHRGSTDASSTESWYLRSVLNCSLAPNAAVCPARGATVPDYRQEVSLYAALPQMASLYGAAILASLNQRISEEELERTRDDFLQHTHAGWGRFIAQGGKRDGGDAGIYGNEGPRFNYRISAMQTGIDLYRRNTNAGQRDYVGVYGAIGQFSGNVRHAPGNALAGNDTLDSYSLGGYWTHFGANNWYADTVVQLSRYDAKANSSRAGYRLGSTGVGMAASLELGLPIRFRDAWNLEPQVQLVYQNISFKKAGDSAARFAWDDTESLLGRVGLRVARTSTQGAASKMQTIWGRVNVGREFMGKSSMLVSTASDPVQFVGNMQGSWIELQLGISLQWSRLVAFYANAGSKFGFDGASRAYEGRIGARMSW